MSNKTVIQTIIEKLEEKNQELSREYDAAKGKANKQALWDRMSNVTFQIMSLQSYLPAEKQMIMDAYDKGFSQIGNWVARTPEAYYNETFKTT